MKFIRSIFSFSVIYLLISTENGAAKAITADGRKIVCPMLTKSELSTYDIPFTLERVDWNLCTHVFSGDESTDGDGWNFKIDKTQEQLLNLRPRYSHLKISLNVRRSVTEYLKFATTKPQALIEQLHTFVKTHQFDGVNLQFDHFEDSNITPEQFKSVVSFVTAIKSKFDRSNLLLTVSLAISKRFDFENYDLSSLSKTVDFITFQENNVPAANDFSMDEAKESLSSIENKIESLIASGVSADKMVMGLSFMGFGFTGTSEDNNEEGTFDRMYRYNEVYGLQLSSPRRWKQTYTDTSLSILKNNEENRAFVIDTVRSIANKVRFVLKLGLAGVAPTSISFDEIYGLRPVDQDTFSDFAVADGVVLNFPEKTIRKFPLLNIINEVTRMTLDEMNQEKKLGITTLKITTAKPPTTSTQPGTVPDLSKENVKVVCQVYKQSDLDAKKVQFDYNKFDWTLCTHVISVEEVAGDPWASKNVHQSKDFKQLTGLKQKTKFPHLKVSLGVKYKLNTYVYMASNAPYQKKVVQKFYDFVLAQNFDGINLQIEDLELSKIRAYEFNKIVEFIATLKEKFNESGLLVTLTIPISARFDFGIYNFSDLSKSVDFINFAFDYIRSTADYRIKDAIKSLGMSTDQERIEKLVALGVLPAKLVLGIHFNGPAFGMAPSGRDEDAKFYQSFGYGSICKAQTDQPQNWDMTIGPAGVSIVRKKEGMKRFTIVLENTQTVANKVQFAIKRGLGGVAPIYIFADDVNGQCNVDDSNPKRSTFPLLRTINETIKTFG